MYEWGNVNISEFLQKLSQEGIHDAKVESSGSSVMIHFVSNTRLGLFYFNPYLFVARRRRSHTNRGQLYSRALQQQ